MLDVKILRDSLRIAIEVKTEKLLSLDKFEIGPDEIYDLIREIQEYKKQLQVINDNPALSFLEKEEGYISPF